jgi:Fic family protein
MSKVVKGRWVSDETSGLPRRDRRPCEYQAYVPDRLAGSGFVLDGDVAADVADAEAAIARMDMQAVALADTEGLARLLLRAESVASSRIEGLEIGGRRLLRAEAARAFGDESSDVTAREVLGNIDAMAWAVQRGGPSTAITPEMLFQVHRRLMAGTRLEAHGGRLRAVQNWIGGSSYNPCSAVFVPPPPELVAGLLDDLCDFCNDDSLPAVAQAAIAHAQFETIHPFVDGNGRTGRALIQLVLRRRGKALRMVPPISLVLATWSDEYVAALNGTRYVGEFGSAAAHEGRNRWIALFAAACRRSAARGASALCGSGLGRRWIC